LIYSYDRSARSAAGKYVEQTNPRNIKIAHIHVNVNIGTEAAQFLFWEYINGIFVAMLMDLGLYKYSCWYDTKQEYLANGVGMVRHLSYFSGCKKIVKCYLFRI
jgi:hypothetical protein